MNHQYSHFSKISDASNSNGPTTMEKLWKISNRNKFSSKEMCPNNYKLHKTNSAYRRQTNSAWLKNPSRSWIYAEALMEFTTQTSRCTFLRVYLQTKINSMRNWWNFFIAKVKERMRSKLLKLLREVSTLMTVFSWTICLSGCLKIKTDQFFVFILIFFLILLFFIIKLIQYHFNLSLIFSWLFTLLDWLLFLTQGPKFLIFSKEYFLGFAAFP
jgi:hypothetical protein